MTIKEKATKSVFWSAIERFSVQGSQFILDILIARMLLPEDYALIAMLSIFMAISQSFIDGGFANALIQKKSRTETDYSTAFFFNILLSIVLYLILYLSAPAIANFFNQEKLVDITRVIGLVLVINSFGIVQRARLTIALDFKSQAIASLTAVLISGSIALWMAYSGYGVWTLVIQTLLNNFLRTLFLWFVSKWSPLWVFSKTSFQSLFGFGSKLLISTLFHTLYTNLYTLVIGKKFLPAQLGFYNRAFKFANFPSNNLTNIMVRAIYPIQCRIQDDLVQLRNMFLQYMRMACYIIFPLMIGMAALAKPMILVLLKEQWLGVVPLLQIMSIAYMWDPVMKINHNILNVKGRSDYFLYAEIIKKIIAFIILFVSIPFGIKVMCLGLILYSFCDMGIIIYYTRKIIQIGWWKQIKSLFPIVLLSFSMGVVVYLSTIFLESHSPHLQLFIGVFVGIIYYLIASFVLAKPEINHLIGIIQKARKKITRKPV